MKRQLRYQLKKKSVLIEISFAIRREIQIEKKASCRHRGQSICSHKQVKFFVKQQDIETNEFLYTFQRGSALSLLKFYISHMLSVVAVVFDFVDARRFATLQKSEPSRFRHCKI